MYNPISPYPNIPSVTMSSQTPYSFADWLQFLEKEHQPPFSDDTRTFFTPDARGDWHRIDDGQLYPSNPTVMNKPFWKWMVAHPDVDAVLAGEKLGLPPRLEGDGAHKEQEIEEWYRESSSSYSSNSCSEGG